MTSPAKYDEYIEALQTLSVLDSRKAEAISRSREAAAESKRKLDTIIAEERKKFEDVDKEIVSARSLLREVYAALGVSYSKVPTTQDTPVRSLKDIRTVVATIAAWAQENKATADSLQRTRVRLMNAAKTAQPAAVVVQQFDTKTNGRRSLPVWVVVVAIVVMALLVVLIVTVSNR